MRLTGNEVRRTREDGPTSRAVLQDEIEKEDRDIESTGGRGRERGGKEERGGGGRGGWEEGDGAEEGKRE